MSEAKLSSDDLLKSFRQSEPSYNDVKWLWTPDKEDFTKYDDVADAYILVGLPEPSQCGIMLFAFYRNEWHANPWSSRAVLKRLLNLCGGEVQDFNQTRQEPEGLPAQDCSTNRNKDDE